MVTNNKRKHTDEHHGFGTKAIHAGQEPNALST